jgi:hypothetical protein
MGFTGCLLKENISGVLNYFLFNITNAYSEGPLVSESESVFLHELN